MSPVAALLACALGLLGATGSSTQGDPYSEAALLGSAPAGPYVGRTSARARTARRFPAPRPLVATYYFFWYDDATGEHFRNSDGSDALTDHPRDPKGYSYKRSAWHRKELEDVIASGIDVILPVYWGAPPDRVQRFPWHDAGIAPLVEAAEAMRASGRTPPAIGLFYDTSSLQPSGNIAGRHVDLSTPAGRAWLYVTIRDFYSQIPPGLRAAVDGRPLVFLYGAGSAKAGTDDPAVFAYVRDHFARDFGGSRPYLVAERSWQARADSAYDWGAAFGPRALGVAAVAPGYDDHAVPGRVSPRIDRQGGATYRRAWERILAMDPRRRPKIAVIETWNELHEGTDIAETREYGRQYIDLTRRYARDWKAGRRYTHRSPFSRALEVSITFGPKGVSEGLRLVTGGDGEARDTSAAGSDCVETADNRLSPLQFLYFRVDSGFYFEPDGPLTVAVEFLDEGDGTLTLDYDSADVRALHAGTYKAAPPVPRGRTGLWKTAVFRLPDARLVHRQNHFTDFRPSAGTSVLRVRRVTVRRAAGRPRERKR